MICSASDVIWIHKYCMSAVKACDCNVENEESYLSRNSYFYLGLLPVSVYDICISYTGVNCQNDLDWHPSTSRCAMLTRKQFQNRITLSNCEELLTHFV